MFYYKLEFEAYNRFYPDLNEVDWELYKVEEDNENLVRSLFHQEFTYMCTMLTGEYDYKINYIIPLTEDEYHYILNHEYHQE